MDCYLNFLLVLALEQIVWFNRMQWGVEETDQKINW
jgi:hypothetical protein